MVSCPSQTSSTCVYLGRLKAVALSTLSRTGRSGGRGCPCGVASPAPPVAASDAVWGLSGAFGGGFGATTRAEARPTFVQYFGVTMSKSTEQLIATQQSNTGGPPAVNETHVHTGVQQSPNPAPRLSSPVTRSAKAAPTQAPTQTRPTVQTAPLVVPAWWPPASSLGVHL